MEGDFIKINNKLLGLAWFYGLGVGIRNLLFEMGILKSRSFSTPVISVGNITVGGTGKTPHVEYLIRLLKGKQNVAVLSRGYKRKSSGFVLISKLTADESGLDIDVVLLDDAFQHRYVKPGINILLVDYHRLVIYDRLLPAGRLREPVKAKDRADIVIITKCPKDLKPMEFRVITKAMNLYPYQQLFFSTLEYDAPRPVFTNEPNMAPVDGLEALAGKNILLLTGIASPEQLMHDLQQYHSQITPLTFGDHHDFKRKDILAINEAFAQLPEPRLVLTTEKDATRLMVVDGLTDDVKRHLYALPLRIAIMQGQQKEFNQKILGYVYKNSRNSILAKRKDDHKSQNSDSTGDRPRTISFRNN